MLHSILILFLLFLCSLPFPITSFQSNYAFKKLKLPTPGSESCAFDYRNRGPYTGLNDGRIVTYNPHSQAFLPFAITSPNRSNHLCDAATNGDHVQCGRPLGLEFDHNTGELYIVDAFLGLTVVGRDGGLATRLGGGKDGVPFDAPDAITIDLAKGVVYFTDIGTIFFKTKNMTEILLSGDTSGRLLKYDPKTKQRTVVLTGLAVPNGIAVSHDGSFVLISEYISCRIRRFWVKGPRANTSDIFVELPGNPDNIRRTKKGDFWVAVNVQKMYPKLTSFPLGQRISVDGKIVETLNLYGEYGDGYVTEIGEHGGFLYVASVYFDFVGVYERRLEC